MELRLNPASPQMNCRLRTWSRWTLLFASLALIGCGNDGPPLGRVSGTVKLNGEPLGEASIEFQPDEGSPSYGLTDEDGEYELLYTTDRKGAMLGKHTVRISTYKALPSEDGSRKEVPELVPAEYNAESTLVREVESGGQTMDFDLEGPPPPPRKTPPQRSRRSTY
jgi:hypothetical protein